MASCGPRVAIRHLVAIWVVLILFSVGYQVTAYAIELPANVVLVEDHSEVLCHWYRAGIRDATALHVDAHPDLYSPTVMIDLPASTLKGALDSNTCGELNDRTTFLVRSHALYGIGNFLTAAHRVGIISRLIWIIPLQGPLDREGYLSFLKLMHEHFPPGFLKNLSFDGDSFIGNLDGLFVRITTLEQMPAAKGRVLLDIDVDWFPALDQLSGEKGTADHLKRLERLVKEVGPESGLVSISASTRGGYTPLAYRYLAGTVLRMFEDPDRMTDVLSGSSPEPGSPGALYHTALTYTREGRSDDTLIVLQGAVMKDPGYARGYSDLAEILEGTAGRRAALDLLATGVRDRPEDLELALAVGNRYLEMEEWERAEGVFSKAIGQGGKVPAFYAGMAFALRGLGRDTEAQRSMDQFLETAHPGEYREAVLERWSEFDAEIRLR